MAIGKQLLFSILNGQAAQENGSNLMRVVELGVDDLMFENPEERDAYAYMQEYYRRYGVVPSLDLVEVETGIRFPQYASRDPFAFWMDQFRSHARKTVMAGMWDDLKIHLENGEETSATDCIVAGYTRLLELTQNRRDVRRLTEMGQEILAKHALLQNGLCREGIPIGFPYIDAVTGGAQPGDLWVLAGESGSGKTFVTCRMAMSSALQGRRTMLIGMEMPNIQIGRRNMALGASVSSSSLRLGRLSRFAIDQLSAFLAEWEASGKDQLLTHVEGKVNMTVEDVLMRIQEHRPDVAFIDGAYMLRMAGRKFGARWEMHMEVLEVLKQVAMEMNLPIIATFQFNQKEKTKSQASIMGGQSIGQIASVVMGIENEDGDRTNFNNVSFKELTLYKGREGESGKIRLRYNMNVTSIEQVEVLEGQEAFIRRAEFDPGNPNEEEQTFDNL